MEKAGLSPANISQKLGVSREAVSRWLAGKSLPRPDKLLKLALTLDLKLDELTLTTEDPNEPVIAFRKRGNTKTTETHIARAKDMGRMLSALVPYLPYDLLVQPATLKNPTTDYAYIQQVASKLRADIGVRPDDELSFNHLIKKFNDLQAVIIPVLWGKKVQHENALHIYLPESMTTWVYLNLDVEVHDFKGRTGCCVFSNFLFCCWFFIAGKSVGKKVGDGEEQDYIEDQRQVFHVVCFL